jgi:hypothetical protein
VQVPHASEVCVVRLLGEILQAAVAHSRAAVPTGGKPGFFQLDEGMEWAADSEGCGSLLRVAGAALDPSRIYRVAVPYHSLNGMHRNQPLIDWANGQNSGGVPHSSLALPLKDVVVRAACGRVWDQLLVNDFAEYDKDHSGYLDRKEIRAALVKLAGNGASVPEFMASILCHIRPPFL